MPIEGQRQPPVPQSLPALPPIRPIRHPDDLARIHNAERIDGLLDGAHDIDGRSDFLLQELHLPLPYAVLSSAGAVHCDGALGESGDQLLGGAHFSGVVGVDEYA